MCNDIHTGYVTEVLSDKQQYLVKGLGYTYFACVRILNRYGENVCTVKGNSDSSLACVTIFNNYKDIAIL